MPRLFLIPALVASLVLPRAAIAQNANRPAAPDSGAWQAPAGSRRYVAVEGVANPWIFDLVIAGGRVTGEARERPANPAVTEASPPFQILNGTARGDTIAFTIESNGGDRVVRFLGLRIGDRIDFQRSVEVVRGAAGGNGIVGSNGATLLSARFVARGQSIPTRAALAQESVTKPLTGPRQTVAHRGFTIDVTEVTSAADYGSVIAAMKGQLDVVANVKMPAATHAFFRTVPIVMQAITGRPRYGAGRVVIPLRSEAPYGSDRPIVLHELCHAYHDMKLAEGFSNPTILGFYEQAKQSGKFPANSYMLSSNTEYFAMMSSVFLHGSAARDPFVRDSIRAKQPAMYDWLVTEFGQRESTRSFQQADTIVERTVAGSPGETISISLRSGGGVTIRSWNQSQVRVRGIVSGTLARQTEVLIARVGGGVELRTITPAYRGDWINRNSFEIWVPTRFNVNISSAGGKISISSVEGRFSGNTGGGEITLDNVSGRADLTTGGGEVSVTNSNLEGSVSTGGGRAVVHNTSGRVSVTSGSGPVIRDGSGAVSMRWTGGAIRFDNLPNGGTFTTGGGEIDIGAVGGKASFTTGGGNVRIMNASDDLSVATGVGSVEISVIGAGARNISVATSLGRAVIELPANLDARLDIESGYTDRRGKTKIESDFPVNLSEREDLNGNGTPRWYVTASGNIGSGRGLIKIRTMNGDVVIRRR